MVMGICTCPPQGGTLHPCNYNAVIFACSPPPRKGGSPENRDSIASAGPLRDTDRAVPAHLRPPERHAARPLGALAIAVGIALLVVAGLGSRPAEEGTTQLVQPATDASTAPTVLGEGVERTSVPEAPPA